jgi:hypothetical protein
MPDLDCELIPTLYILSHEVLAQEAEWKLESFRSAVTTHAR